MKTNRISASACALIALVLGSMVGCDGDHSKIAAGPGSGVTVQQPNDVTNIQHELAVVQQLAQRGQLDQAQLRINALLIEHGESPQVLFAAAGISLIQQRFDDAADLFAQSAKYESGAKAPLLLSAAKAYMRAGRFELAEKSLLSVVNEEPLGVEGHRLLATLYNEQGRRFEANEQSRELARLGAANAHELLTLIDGSGPFAKGDLRAFDLRKKQGKASLLDLADARVLFIGEKKTREAISALKALRNERPADAAVHSFLGLIYSTDSSLEQLAQWHSDAPEGCDVYPEYWTARAVWSSRSQDHSSAIRASIESLRRDPTQRTALRVMAASLRKLQLQTEANQCEEVLRELDKLFLVTGEYGAKPTVEFAKRIAKQLEDLNRFEESLCWRVLAASQAGTLKDEMNELVAERTRLLKPDSNRPTAFMKLVPFDSQKLLGDMPASGLADVPEHPVPSKDDRTIQMRDVAMNCQLDVPFKSGMDIETGVFRLYQTNGGGVGITDFDLDGEVDIYIAQSDGPPNKANGSSPNNLMRLEGDVFSDVSQLAGVDDRSLAQGVAIGDLNQDGWPDIAIANIGANVILINQGDGTFANHSELLRDSSESWTSSVAIADLSGDHLPEIVEVNYVDDQLAFERECSDVFDPCAPWAFNPAADAIHKGTANGSFVPWKSGLEMSSEFTWRHGFSPLIVNFDQKHGNDLFVGNDAGKNDFWVSKPDKNKPGSFTLRQLADLKGCAYGMEGTADACMGVAAGDLDGNGMIDLHVTNFYNESANLFMQDLSGTFTDEALNRGLHRESEKILGFGSQAADFDNDGWPDLAVLNGHVYDARKSDVPYRMLPQLFAGGPAEFQLIDSEASPNYWSQPQLGRTLARVDWNRDGRADLVATHLDRPVALLENVTENAGCWLQLELVGTESERDAVGAKVTVKCGDRRWYNWRTAGDGYMCSNESAILFGLADQEVVDRLVIDWPSGNQAIIEDVKARCRYLIVEGKDELVVRFGDH